MFWIIGADALLNVLTKNVKTEWVPMVAAQFTEHVEWEGFRFYDMIFPLFLFIIGAVMPFSIEKRLEEGAEKRSVLAKVIRRTLMLFLLGLIYNGLLRFEGWDQLRIFGVLQRQAIGYFFAALFVLYTKPKTQIWSIVGILLGYWAIMAGFGHGDYTPQGNFANHIDRLVLLPKQMCESYGDPEGPLSMIPAVATALFGVLSGRWLKQENPDRKKVLGLVAVGVGLVLLGLAWSPWFPIIKKIWTSSYTLVAGGASMLLLAAFYWVVDVKGWRKWALPFVLIGMNPITIYLLSEIVDFGKIGSYFLGGVAARSPANAEAWILAGALLAKFGLLYFLYTKKAFFRV